MPRLTPVIPLNDDEPDPHAITQAAGILRRGGLVAFATETVYGLGADASGASAVEGAPDVVASGVAVSVAVIVGLGCVEDMGLAIR